MKLLEMEPYLLIIASLLGRPKGQQNDTLSLAPVVAELVALLQRKVPRRPRDGAAGQAGQGRRGAARKRALQRGGEGGEEQVARFSAILTGVTDLFVCDAFGTSTGGLRGAHQDSKYDVSVNWSQRIHWDDMQGCLYMGS